MSALAVVAAVVATAVAVDPLVADVVSNHSYHPSFRKTGNEVAVWTQCTGVNPWELSKLEDTDILSGTGSALMEDRKWQNHTVPYFIEVTDFSKRHINRLRAIIKGFNKYSCLKFLEADSYVRDYVRITGRRHGCYSQYRGRMGGKQVVNLQAGNCLSLNTVMHELFHVIGFGHQHNAPDRDSYISVIYNNIDKADHKYFRIYTDKDNTTNGIEYDYESIMHISKRAHSKNQKNTVEPHEEKATIGRVTGPSYYDIMKLEKYYCKR